MDDDITDAGSGEHQAVAVTRWGGPAVPRKSGPKGPWLYTPERVHELAVSLERYFDATDSLFVESWACTEGLHMRQIHRLAQDSEEFQAAFDRVCTVQASRLLEGSTRPMDTTTNRIGYSVNPKIAALVLMAKHDFGAKGEMVLRTPETSQYAQVESARKALQAAMPSESSEARQWLTGIMDNSPDDSTRVAVEQLMTRLDIEREAIEAGSAICDF